MTLAVEAVWVGVMEQRELYGELTALLNAAATRLEVDAEILAKAFETGQAAIDFVEDEEGGRALLVSYHDRQAALTPDDLAQALAAVRGADPDGSDQGPR